MGIVTARHSSQHSQKERRFGQDVRNRHGEVNVTRRVVVHRKAQPQHRYDEKAEDQHASD